MLKKLFTHTFVMLGVLSAAGVVAAIFSTDEKQNKETI